MRGVGLEPMHHQAIVEEEENYNNTILEVEPTHESIDLPITTSENVNVVAAAGPGVGEGLRKQRPQMMSMEDSGMEVDTPVLEEQKESSTTTASQQ